MQLFGARAYIYVYMLDDFSIAVYYFTKDGPLQKHIHFCGNSEWWYGQKATKQLWPLSVTARGSL